MRRLPIAFLLALAAATPVFGHVPSSAIGRAVTALRSTPVSYETGAVSDLEADAFLRLSGVGDGIAVATMPASALQEISGGPDAVAAEVAREAGASGTVLVLVGARLGAWSDRVPESRLRAMVETAQQAPGGPVAQVRDLVARLYSEPQPAGGGHPWAWIAAVPAVLMTAVAAFFLVGRRRSSSRSRAS